MKILICTNDMNTNTELGAIFEKEGHVCVMVSDSGNVIDIVYRESPEIIIIDSALRNPSALNILERLKDVPSSRQIPVIFAMSGKSAMKIEKAYSLGAHDFISKPFIRAEILARVNNINYVLEKMKDIERMLVRDYLTGLYNRRFFMERFADEIDWARRQGDSLSLIMIDLDHFKHINDRYGHSCGDEILKQISELMINLVRPHDIVARYGGEEFIILLPNVGHAESLVVAERLRSKVECFDFFCNDRERKIEVTISLGVTSLSGGDDINAEEMIISADNALYEAKKRGRNRVIWA